MSVIIATPSGVMPVRNANSSGSTTKYAKAQPR